MQPHVITVSVDESRGTGYRTRSDCRRSRPSRHSRAITSISGMGHCQFWRVWTFMTGMSRPCRRHRSIEFIALLEGLDSHYPPDCTVA